MGWFKIDDQATFHGKVIAAGNEAYGAWTRAGAWSSAYLTEGHIPRDTALTIAPEKVWRRLVAVGLCEDSERGGWDIHDYLDFNPTKEEALAKRNARSEAGRRGGRKSAAVRSKPQANAQAIASTAGRGTASRRAFVDAEHDAEILAALDEAKPEAIASHESAEGRENTMVGSANARPQREAIASGVAQAKPKQNSTPSPSPSPYDIDIPHIPQGKTEPDARVLTPSEPKPKRGRVQAKPKALMRADWQPAPEHVATAKANGLDVAAIADDFRAYWMNQGKAGADWQAAFANEIRKVLRTDWLREKYSNGLGVPVSMVNATDGDPPKVDRGPLDETPRIRPPADLPDDPAEVDAFIEREKRKAGEKRVADLEAARAETASPEYEAEMQRRKADQLARLRAAGGES